jgi:hypothetical protein
MDRIMRFPRMVTRYMDRNGQKKKGCNSGLSVSPRRKNLETAVFVSGFHVVDDVDGKAKVDTTKSATVRRC